MDLIEIMKNLITSFITFMGWVVGFKIFYKITKTSSLIDDIYRWIKK